MAEISPELQDEMVAHFRRVVEKYKHVKDDFGACNDELREARAIVAKLPQPVDPDLIEAREVYARIAESVHDDRIEAKHARSGILDDDEYVKLVLAAIKRGRELERAALSERTL